MMKCFLLVLLCTVGLTACGSGGSKQPQGSTPPSNNNLSVTDLAYYPAGQAIPQNQTATNLRILFFGNSHSSAIPPLVETMLRTGQPDKTVMVQLAPGISFLSERLYQSDSRELLNSKAWTHLVLQGQKYSQSMSQSYPTTAAQVWIRMAKQQNVMPILFPEHGQKNKSAEATYVHGLHMDIARREASCVAPVGLAWDRVQQIYPQLALHHTDGNHASYTGNVLTAYVLYEMISGQAADLLPYIDSLELGEDIQSQLSQLASETISIHNNCSDLFDGN